MDRVQLAQDCRVTTRKQVTFNHYVPNSSGYSFDQPQKTWDEYGTTYLFFFNLRLLDWFFVLTCHWKEVLTLLVHILLNETFQWEEAAARRLSLRLSLKISSNLQENNSVGVSFSQRCRPACKRVSHEDFSCEFSEIFWKKTPFLQNTSSGRIWICQKILWRPPRE